MSVADQDPGHRPQRSRPGTRPAPASIWTTSKSTSRRNACGASSSGQDGHYQISKAVRELCVFSRHNLASDPPFCRLDLISCRNVLIYMDAALQKRVLPLLHYALNPDGFLFLGTSENVGTFSDLFAAVDARHRIFTRNTRPASGGRCDFGTLGFYDERRRRRIGRDEADATWSALDVQREADRVLLARYAPVGVVVDENMTVLQFRGRTAPYLEPAPGMASLDLLRMLREGLLAEVRAAAIAGHGPRTPPSSREGMRLARRRRLPAGQRRSHSVQGAAHGGALLPGPVPGTWRAGRARPWPPPPRHARSPAEQQVGQLQQELGRLREYLQSVIEEHESTNEELKSANEEILSANEELQSTNEELQTAKEEAQSANEELATVNDELRHRNTELGRVNNDLVNLLSGVSIAHRHGQPRPAHPPLHAAGREGVQPDPDRRGPAHRRHQAQPGRPTIWPS